MLAGVIAVLILGAIAVFSQDDAALERFRERADAVCADASLELGLVRPPDADDVEGYLAFLDSSLEANRRAERRFETLTPPAALESRLQDLVDHVRAANEGLANLRDAIEAGDRAGVDAALAATEVAKERFRNVATELGLNACSSG